MSVVCGMTHSSIDRLLCLAQVIFDLSHSNKNILNVFDGSNSLSSCHFINLNLAKFYDWMHFLASTLVKFGDGNQNFYREIMFR